MKSPVQCLTMPRSWQGPSFCVPCSAGYVWHTMEPKWGKSVHHHGTQHLQTWTAPSTAPVLSELAHSMPATTPQRCCDPPYYTPTSTSMLASHGFWNPEARITSALPPGGQLPTSGLPPSSCRALWSPGWSVSAAEFTMPPLGTPGHLWAPPVVNYVVINKDSRGKQQACLLQQGWKTRNSLFHLSKDWFGMYWIV